MHNWTLEGMPNNLEHLLNVIWYKKYNKDIWSYCIWNTFDYTRQENGRWEVRGGRGGQRKVTENCSAIYYFKKNKFWIQLMPFFIEEYKTLILKVIRNHISPQSFSIQFLNNFTKHAYPNECFWFPRPSS